VAFTLKKNDTRPMFVAALRDKAGTGAEEPLDLTGATEVLFLMRLESATGPLVVTGTAEVTDAEEGVVQYEWSVGDTEISGTFVAEFQITWADGGIETVPNDGYVSIVITDDLGPEEP
jgi:hypothetical protein